jgi:hypothetical protein
MKFVVIAIAASLFVASAHAQNQGGTMPLAADKPTAPAAPPAPAVPPGQPVPQTQTSVPAPAPLPTAPAVER